MNASSLDPHLQQHDALHRRMRMIRIASTVTIAKNWRHYRRRESSGPQSKMALWSSSGIGLLLMMLRIYSWTSITFYGILMAKEDRAVSNCMVFIMDQS